MTAGYVAGMSDDRSLEKQMEKQMGCMAGFRQIFDRHQILAGKRLQSTKRLPPSTAVDSEKFVTSQTLSRELQPQQQEPLSTVDFAKPAAGDDARERKGSPSPELRPATSRPAEIQARMPLPLPLFEFKDGLRSSWKLREAPRLSLDSRAIVDGKGSVFPREIRTNAAIFAATNREMSAQSMALEEENDGQRRSPSVVARLMGLDALPDSVREPPKNAELRRSASESRVSRDLMQCRYFDGNSFQNKQLTPQKLSSTGTVRCNTIQDNAVSEERSKGLLMPDSMKFRSKLSKCESPKDPMANTASSPWNMKKSFFDSQDFFPEPKRTGSLYGEIEKRLKMRGIDEPEKDLETLKQILEALQLKGLLHSKRSKEPITDRRNFIHDRKFASEESPIVVMKPARSPVSTHRHGRTGNESTISNSRQKARIRQNLVTETLPPVRPRRDRAENDRNLQNERSNRVSRPSSASDSGAKSPSSLARRRVLSVETQKQGKDCNERRSSSCISPKNSPKRVGSDLTTSRSPRNRKSTTEISPKERISALTEDESSTISESSISASSQIDCELQRTKMEEYKEGRSLLERCDKLLHSIAEITATEQQPSPVSVLDSTLYKEDSSPSPVMKRCIDFKDQSAEAKEDWSLAISPVRSAKPDEESDDHDFLFVSEILSHKRTYWEEDSDLFVFLEKQYYKRTNSSSKVSRLHRRLVFDTVTEILNKKQQLLPWKAFVRSKSAAAMEMSEQALVRQIWSEIVRIRERPPAENPCDVICGHSDLAIVARDMAHGDGMDGWDDRSVEMSEAVLDIERLIFKDLVGEAIRDLASFTGKCRASVPRRKLAF